MKLLLVGLRENGSYSTQSLRMIYVGRTVASLSIVNTPALGAEHGIYDQIVHKNSTFWHFIKFFVAVSLLVSTRCNVLV